MREEQQLNHPHHRYPQGYQEVPGRDDLNKNGRTEMSGESDLNRIEEIDTRLAQDKSETLPRKKAK